MLLLRPRRFKSKPVKSSPQPTASPLVLRYLLALGPAVIVASVVLGPGSILTSSKVGAEYGYRMVWVLVLAALLMAGMTAVGARIGVALRGSPGDELAARLGRPAAALAGICVFLICGCFQFGNNLGVLAALAPLMQDLQWTDSSRHIVTMLLLLGLNGFVIAALFGLKHLYQPIERLMMVLVGLMLLGFATNLVLAQADFGEFVKGFIPSLPARNVSTQSQRFFENSLLPLLGMFATTFSVAGAYYQAYLVREKGWTTANLKQGFLDSLAVVTVLGGISLMIMATSAAVLHGRVDAAKLQSAGDVALQLQPLFGTWATVLFCLGIFGGAFSSFLMNAMIGGGLLADGFGLGSQMDGQYAKLFTVAALLMGMAVAIAFGGNNPVTLIVFTQALTVIGLPPLAAAMLYLLQCTDQRKTWPHMVLTAIAVLGLITSLVLAIPTLYKIWERLSGS